VGDATQWKTKWLQLICLRLPEQNGRKKENVEGHSHRVHWPMTSESQTTSVKGFHSSHEGRKASCLTEAIPETEVGTCNEGRYVPA
jgi:hypothetical protein